MGLDPADYRSLAFASGNIRLEGWPGYVFVLHPSDPQNAARNLAEISQQFPDSGRVLVFSHFPPEEIENAFQCFAKNLQVDWICGHLHQSEDRQAGNITVHAVACLDPIKCRGSIPELLMVDWDGSNIKLQRITVPLDLLKGGARMKNPLGLAFLGTPEALLKTGLVNQTQALQFKLGPDDMIINSTLKKLMDENKKLPAFLSVHLSEPFALQPEDWFKAILPQLEWAAELKLDDITVHLPNVPCDQMFDREQLFPNPMVWLTGFTGFGIV